MKDRFNYTRSARNFALRFPTLNHLLIQINFWIIAFTVLSVILYLNSQVILESNNLPPFNSAWPGIIISLVGGTFFGLSLGLTDGIIEKKSSKCLPMGIVILFHIIVYYIILIALMMLLKFVVWEMIILPVYYNNASPFDNKIMWKSFYRITLIYSFMMTLVISFINQMKKKFGPGVLLPMLFGKYRNPKEEERIFMFMDLRASTTLAEKLGHLKYSSLIRDSFTDINQVLLKHEAEIYQYVGDEIVVSWPLRDGQSKQACVEFFFSCQDQFNSRKEHYESNYGSVPKFKAGLHQGFVTAVEVGEIKREIAYHGDAINTASRIQQKCNDYNSDFLISESFNSELEWKEKFSRKFVGKVNLKGKEEAVNIYSVSLI